MFSDLLHGFYKLGGILIHILIKIIISLRDWGLNDFPIIIHKIIFFCIYSYGFMFFGFIGISFFYFLLLINSPEYKNHTRIEKLKLFFINCIGEFVLGP